MHSKFTAYKSDTGKPLFSLFNTQKVFYKTMAPVLFEHKIISLSQRLKIWWFSFDFKILELRSRSDKILNMILNFFWKQCQSNAKELGETDGEILVMQLETQRTVKPGTQLTIRYSDYTQVSLSNLNFHIYFCISLFIKFILLLFLCHLRSY